MNKVRERARLLKAYRKTGDEDYRRAAEALKIPLLNHIEQLSLYPGRGRGPTVAKEARSRLYRMHRMVVARATVHAAARREVAEHGRGAHATEDAAIDYLRHSYPEHAESIAAELAAGRQLSEPFRQIARSAEQFNRMVQASIPPEWIMNIGHDHLWTPWVRSARNVARTVMHPIAAWRNTLPKNGQEKIQ